MSETFEKLRMLVTFVQVNQDENLDDRIEMISEDIKNTYDVRSDLFVFKKMNRNEDTFITFKAHVQEGQVQLDNTKFINWKPQTNTFYTINALNYLIMGETGEKDVAHQVNWARHRNKLIMLRQSREVEGRKELSEYKIRRYARILKDGTWNRYNNNHDSDGDR